VSSPAIFLRKRCLTPEGMSLRLTTVDSVWDSVDMSEREFTTAIESHGWHCMWLTGRFSRVSVGRTAETATSKVMKAGLDALSTSFNAAEVDLLRVATYRGFSVARVTIHARHVQREATLVPWTVRRKELDGDQTTTP
jgi:hypothetical protein